MTAAPAPEPRRWFPLSFVFQAYLIQGLAEGILRSVVLPQMAVEGVEVEVFAGIAAWGILPWAFKFLWAPWLDRARSPAPEQLSKWVFMAELGAALVVALCLATPANLSEATRLKLLFFGLNCGLALQDAATDAFAIDSFPTRDRNLAQTLMQLAQHLGTAGLAALGVGYLVANYGMAASQWALFTALLLSAALRFAFSRLRPRPPSRPASSLSPGSPSSPGIFTPLKELLRSYQDRQKRRQGAVIVAIAGTAMLAHACTSAVAAGFLFQRLSWSVEAYQRELAPLVSAVSLGAYLLLLPWAKGIATRKLLVSTGLGIGILWAGLGMAEGLWDRGGHPLIWGYAAAEALLTALFFVALYAEFMRHCAGPLRATLFVALMALLNLSRFAGTWMGPELLKPLGYGGLFIVAGIYQITWTWGAFAATRRPARVLAPAPSKPSTPGPPTP